jgi:cold-inducible RNA-binding protein
MAKKIYVGNLSYSVSDEDLQGLFEKIGSVASVRILKDEATGRSRGFGFVEMTSDEEAEKAIKELNGKTFMERALTVNEARPQTGRKQEGRRGKSFGSGRSTGSWR